METLSGLLLLIHTRRTVMIIPQVLYLHRLTKETTCMCVNMLVVGVIRVHLNMTELHLLDFDCMRIRKMFRNKLKIYSHHLLTRSDRLIHS